MSKKLDPEGLGIILLNAFMDEFFPEEKRSTPDTFNLVHYNGIPRSNFDDKVCIELMFPFSFSLLAFEINFWFVRFPRISINRFSIIRVQQYC